MSIRNPRKGAVNW